MIDISIFNNNLFEAGTEFFNRLGIRLNSNTASSLEAKDLLKGHYKDKDIFKTITETYFLGLVDDSVFDGNAPLLRNEKISLQEAAGRINADYNGLMVFAVKLDDSCFPARGRIAELTRSFNRVSQNIPVVLLLKYGNLLSFATSERTTYKQEWREGEKIGKISLLKDINIDSPHTGHLKILDDLKVKPHVTDFDALYKQWQEVFDVQLLNKNFYQKLANWYFWAIKTVTFPDDVEKDEGVRNATNVIRLITRLIFVWFVKEKRLVSDKLFDPDYLKDILNYSDKTGSTYYKAILQNLFFATLNTEMNKDTPGSRKFVSRQYGIPYFYRNERFFTDRKKVLELFENIPFLNGGLFECLDKNVGQDDEIRIDCFSNSPRKADRLIVPDKLFFSPEHAIDLNKIYGTKSKSYKVRGIIDILNSYKFTITENTPVEEEIALDPELLGKVFENLLASYNPETQTTARKQTGSFYTPREIVNYMVDESLIAYLSSKVPSPLAGEGKCEGDNTESRLRKLLAYTEEPHQFTVQEVDVLINAIDSAKILDPACGSGAFPMGILHKMVHILHKLDPDNEKWKQRQIDKVLEIPDATVREQLLEEIEESFQNNELDYGRKLYLIENCIYGIDIQPIAVQIAKLRFFISLIVDQGIDTDRKNLGIRPLPNLETKFVAANTLIGIEKPRFETLGLRNPEIDLKEKKLKQVREKHFSARTPKTKDKYRLEDARLRAELAELFKNDGFSAETTHKLAHWDPYDQNASADFFDPEWMFGIKDGFDVVIGNPPYVSHDKITNKHEIKKNYLSYEPFADIYCYFIECAINFQNENGIFAYITSNSYLRSDYGKPIRKLIAQENSISNIINIEDSQVFECAIVNVAIIIAVNSKKNKKEYCHVVNSQYDGHISFTEFVRTKGFDYPQEVFTDRNWNLIEPELYSIQKKIEKDYKTLEQLGSKIRLGLATGHNKAFIIDDAQKEELCKLQRSNAEIIKPILRGRDISRFSYKLPGLYILLTKNGIDVKNDYPFIYKHLKSFGNSFKRRGAKGQHWTNLRACAFFDDFKKEKIVWIELTDIGRFALCTEEIYLLNSAYFLLPPKGINVKYLLGVLNSRIIKFYLSIIAETSGMGTSRWINNFVKEFPIPLTSQELQSSIITHVDQILTAKQKDPQADTTELENKIDIIVYKLYALTYEEVKIIDPEFWMTKEEYERVGVMEADNTQEDKSRF